MEEVAQEAEMKKMLDAGCWMLDAGSDPGIQHPASSIFFSEGK
jgi:hypothetical protein